MYEYVTVETDAVPLDCCDDCPVQFQASYSVLQSREITLVFYFFCIYSHTPSPGTFLFDVLCNRVIALVSRIWSKANPYPYVFRNLCNSISVSAQKKRHEWTKGSQRKSSVSGLYRRKYLHLSSLLILFGDLRGTDGCIDISTVRWENFDVRKKLQYLKTFWQLAATHYSDWALKEATQ